MVNLDAFTPSPAAFALFCRSCDPWHTGRGLRDQRPIDMRASTAASRAPTLRRAEYIVILDFMIEMLKHVHTPSSEFVQRVKERFAVSNNCANPYDSISIITDAATMPHPLFAAGTSRKKSLLSSALENTFDIITSSGDAADVADLRAALKCFYGRVSKYFDVCHPETCGSSPRRGVRSSFELSKCTAAASSSVGLIAVRPCDVIHLAAAVWSRSGSDTVEVPDSIRSDVRQVFEEMCVYNHDDDKPNIVAGRSDRIVCGDQVITVNVGLSVELRATAVFISPVRPILKSFKIIDDDDDDGILDISDMSPLEIGVAFGEMQHVTIRHPADLDRLKRILTDYNIMSDLPPTTCDVVPPLDDTAEFLFKRPRQQQLDT